MNTWTTVADRAVALDHAARRAGYPLPVHAHPIRLLVANYHRGNAELYREADDTAPIPGGHVLARTVEASLGILNARIEAYDDLAAQIDRTNTTSAGY